jgi:hypothetical protein
LPNFRPQWTARKGAQDDKLLYRQSVTDSPEAVIRGQRV